METEQSLLAAILENGSLMNYLDIQAEHFSIQSHQDIFRAMIEVSKDRPVDLVTIHSHLLETKKQDFMCVLRPIIKSARYTNEKSAQTYSEIIKKASRASQKLRILNEAIIGEKDVDEIISELMAINKEGEKFTHSLRDSMRLAYQEIEAAHNGVVGVDTGYKDINRLIGGWRNSDLYIIGARPAMGKTALMINFARLSSAKSLIVSGEQPAAQVAMRLISQSGNIKSTRLRNAQMEDHEWSACSAVMGSAQDTMVIYDKPNPTITDILQQARRSYHENGIRLIFVDYVQKIRPSRKHNTKAEEVAEVVEGLKILARELNVPVVALAQVNREVNKLADKRPTMAHLKDSGTIEQEADAVAMLYRDSVYNEDADPTKAELNFEKNRHGPIGAINLTWNADYMRFENEDY